MPPLTLKFCPLTHAASGDAKNKTLSAISSGLPRRFAEAVRRCPTLYHLHRLLRLPFIEQLGTSGTWRYSIHSDAPPAEIFGHDSGHLLDGPFGRSVQQVVGCDVGSNGDRGREQDDTTAVRHTLLHSLTTTSQATKSEKARLHVKIDLPEPKSMGP